MPTAVLMMIGQIEVMKITKIALGCPSRKAASDSGSQASGGIVRSTWKIGSRPRMAQIDWPITAPMSTPTTAARPKPMPTRCSDVSTRQPRPMSCGPATKKGSVMRSFASFQTCEGGGRLAPALPKPICQIISRISSVMSGGRVTAAMRWSTGRMRDHAVRRGGVKARTGAFGRAVAVAVLASRLFWIAVMDMSILAAGRGVAIRRRA